MPIPVNSSDDENNPTPPISSAAESVAQTTTRPPIPPLPSTAPSVVAAPGCSSQPPHSLPSTDPKDPLGLKSLPPAGSFLPGFGYVPQMPRAPIMSAQHAGPAAEARPAVSAAQARPSRSAAVSLEPEASKVPERRHSDSSGKYCFD